MTSHCFRRGKILAKDDIPEKRTNCNCKHYPAIVCHEKKPCSESAAIDVDTSKYLHNEEAVEDLHSI